MDKTKNSPHNDLKCRDILWPMKVERKGNIKANFSQVPISKEKTINTVFTWNFGGKSVRISGNWDNWKKSIPLVKSGNEFSAIVPLILGKYQYKYTVDGEWKYSPINEVLEDRNGNINNIIEVSFKETKKTKDFSFVNILQIGLNENLNLTAQSIYGPPWNPPSVPIHLGGFMVNLEAFRKKKIIIEKKISRINLSPGIVLNRVVYLNVKLNTQKILKIPMFKLRSEKKYFGISSFILDWNKFENLFNPVKLAFFCQEYKKKKK